MKSLKSCRQDFPALSRKYNGRNLVFLDGPGGSQVPNQVITAIKDYYENSNSNTHGAFITTRETDSVIEAARERMAALMGASGPDTISFGQNMTTLNFSISKALARYLRPGSEILITQLDHEANRGPWLNLQERGFIIKEVLLNPDGTLNYDDFKNKISRNTGLIAVGYASNALGTVNDLRRIYGWSSEAGCLLLVDAVHFAPHFGMDVTTLDCDFLMCSAYKFYGPHVGILYTRPGLLDSLSTDRLNTQDAEAPYRVETGTLNHAALAGVTAAVDYLASFGNGMSVRDQIIDTMKKIQSHEYSLFTRLYSGLESLPGISIIGPPPDPQWHTPTVAFTLEGMQPEDICRQLGTKSICAWDGHFYALKAIEALGLLDQGGVTRLGVSMYTTEEEVEYTIQTIAAIANNI